MLPANHWTELRVPNGGDGEGTEGAEGVCSPMKGATLTIGQNPWSSRGLDHQHMQGPMVLAVYVAENGLVGHQWEEKPLGLRVFDAPV